MQAGFDFAQRLTQLIGHCCHTYSGSTTKDYINLSFVSVHSSIDSATHHIVAKPAIVPELRSRRYGRATGADRSFVRHLHCAQHAFQRSDATK